ncbi:PstS family phosphate ABC transporter substrate-binding protein [Halomonas urumqiensis]|uniref:Phosphate ABC transporter substrate-binding protein n=1 Tax=Halomonas urumqiensis TaxID=1684789 RepID=A0A2N7UJK7_9GAMM|nr:substrate-binding domain-containing protein [Halomonas urumqiensis]PMR80626.1 phosphate ABC transporter substrate-binding protein [Halomonas urumqiensis]PTB02699.1 phosphate ABC transporter substrate-binding protein [Halomonas urumqiensis]
MALVMLPTLGMTDEGVGDVAGNLGAVGSDTLASLMLRWGERLAEQHPGVRLQLLASGSASAPAALAAGTTRLGPMSRPMRVEERQEFIDRHGYPPLEIEVARDALVVVVHRHHPLEALSAEQLDAIFSTTRECGAETPITRWSQLGLTLPADRIVLHGRNVASGTHGLFREVALCGGDYRVRVNEHMGSAAVVAAVAAEPSSIGYTGMNHLTASVKALARKDEQGQLHTPSPESVRSGEYPMARGLYLYVNLPPGQPLPAPERAFIELTLSPEGQQIVRELGFVPLSDAQLDEERHALLERLRDDADHPGGG